MPSPLVSAARALPIIENGNCDSAAPAPIVTPERLRNERRSIVLPSIPDTERASRLCDAETLEDFLVSNMEMSPSDSGGAVVLADVVRDVVALRPAHRFTLLGLRLSA